MMPPKQRYQSDLDAGFILYDDAQRSAVEKLEELYQQLLRTHARDAIAGPGWKRKLFPGRRVPSPRGIYFWGGVGRGKTYLMDVFYDALPFKEKLRTHFHRFMQRVHQELRDLKGEKDPLKRVAQNLAGQARVICFDEFFVSDIGDAMILAGLLEALFDNGVVFVTTSNCEPSRLYENGLQRSRFLPAIRLLGERLDIVELDGGTDYRLRSLSRAPLYHYPLSDNSDDLLRERFVSLAPDFAQTQQNRAIEILGRAIRCRYVSDDVIWFDFEQLCGGPRSVHDYIELARLYHAVILGNLPQLGVDREDQARRFINLVDELYDRGVKLVIAAAVPLDDLYLGVTLRMEFQRTQSRLLEMQSHEYLARPHRP